MTDTSQTGERLTAMGIALDSWRLTATVLSRMPVLFIGVMVLNLIVGTAIGMLNLGRGWASVATVGVLSAVWQAVSIAALLVAVHRFVLLGEVLDAPAWRPPATYGRFLGWAVLLELLPLPVAAVALIFAVISPGISALVTAAVIVVIWVFCVRIIPIFPAIAVGSPYGTVSGALGLSQGHAWWIFGVLVLTFVPAMLVLMVIGASLAMFSGIGGQLVNAVLPVLLAPPAAISASRIFQKLTGA